MTMLNILKEFDCENSYAYDRKTFSVITQSKPAFLEEYSSNLYYFLTDRAMKAIENLNGDEKKK